MTQGLIQVYTGDGKGKTTAAFGLALRAIGRGLRVTIVQFLKSDSTGEVLAAKTFENLTVIRVNTSTKFTWNMSATELEELTAETHEGYKKICQIAKEQRCDILILDEINHAINKEFISKNEMMHFFDSKPLEMEVVLTGRNAPDWLLEKADLVTEMKCIKHPYNNGIGSRVGIER
jgi:cob(I)alamin adenosyltransferase